MLKVIGIGYPRTGTMSLKYALEELRLGPCYHMIEVFERPDDVAFWESALASQGADVEWHSIFAEFQSTADCPGCYFWRSLYAAFPTVRYVLTVRDPETWYDSFRATVYEAMTHPERAPDEQHQRVQVMASKLILEEMFESRFEDRSFAIQKYEEHNRAVVDALPPEQLLVFDVADGWEPLCRFLDVPVPQSSFPQANTRTEFRQRFAIVPGTESQ